MAGKQPWRKGSGDPGGLEKPWFSLAKAKCFPEPDYSPLFGTCRSGVSSSGLPRIRQTWTHWRKSSEDKQPDQGLEKEHMMPKGRLQELGSFFPKKRRGRQDLMAAYNDLHGSWGEDR